MIEICTVGGYSEVGRNMTAVKVDDEVVILDLGLELESYIRYTEESEDLIDLRPSTLMTIGAVPNIKLIEPWLSKVKAIVPTHAHLDHIGAIPYLAKKIGTKEEPAPVIATPFTITVLDAILKDEKIKLKNKLVPLSPNSFFKLTDNITIEFIHITHSTPQTVVIALHTKYGVIVYANDFKLDNHPVLGKKPNYERLEELGKGKGKEKVLALIMDSTYAREAIKMPSEIIAREMLRDVMLEAASEDKALLVTTFSSHLARLKSIIEFGKKINRKIIFMGRSLAKYVLAGEKIGIINFSKDVEIVKYGAKIKNKLSSLTKKDLSKYLLVVTGHQGEPRAVLSRMVNKVLPFKLGSEDCVVFSCKIIPNKVNVKNRKILEDKIKAKNVRIFKDIHVSGHAAREDQRELINLINPKNIIPAHGEKCMTSALADLAIEMGFKKNKSVHLMSNGKKLKIVK